VFQVTRNDPRSAAKSAVDLPRQSVSGFSRRYDQGLSICIPAYNEENTIRQVVMEADATLERTSMSGEILVIDDGSTDRTWQILCGTQHTMPRLKLRRHETNQGIAATFAELYQWAGKELVFLNSADGQWKMSTLLQLLPLADRHEIVIARRPVKHYSLGRHVVSWLFNALPVIFFATRTYDAGSVKLVRRAIYDDIPVISRGVFGEAERIIRAQRRGLRIGVRDVEHYPRTSGKALGAKPELVVQAMVDLLRCWFDIVVLRRK
jgi:glycosyltransferase involved in cell wall biosynthesis